MKIGYPDKWENYSELNIKSTDTPYTMHKKLIEFHYNKEFMEKINKPVDKTEWHMSPQTVNAYYNPLLNEIVFPAAILQPPFYVPDMNSVDIDVDKTDTSLKKPINYGSICAVIAHEITHGFDDKGCKFDAYGNMKNWWTDEDMQLFKSRAHVMHEQALNHNYTDSKGNVYTMNPTLTMGENLADLGGMTLSLKAMISDPDIKLTKKVLQVFFMSFANIWKRHMKEEQRINRITSDPHAPAEYRANLVNNIDEFYDAFNITPDDDMYLPPKKRVRMW